MFTIQPNLQFLPHLVHALQREVEIFKVADLWLRAVHSKANLSLGDSQPDSPMLKPQQDQHLARGCWQEQEAGGDKVGDKVDGDGGDEEQNEEGEAQGVGGRGPKVGCRLAGS